MSHFICIDFNIFYVTFISVSTFVVINKQNIYLLELKMNTINEEFNIPYYIFEEITEYCSNYY